MKIGILTYHRAHNYGALLQAFALKTWIEKQGHEVELVDYWPKYHSDEYKPLYHFKARSFPGKIKAILLLLLGFRKTLQRRKGYEMFMQNQLGLQPEVKYPDITSLKDLTYDLIIYGSDQIWRKMNYPLYTGFDEIYWGSKIAAKRKISYAASMGVIALEIQSDQEFLKKQIRNFQRVAVRENELQEKVKLLTGTKPELVLDPVFLLTKKQWEGYIQKPRIASKYILLYQLTKSDESVQLAEKLKRYLGFPVIEILGRVNPIKIGERYLQTASPLDFISLINNAEFVISTSFHGTAFSVIFEKQFYALGMGNNHGRAKSLLKNIGLEKRYLENFDKADLNSKIDYAIVNTRLHDCINNSLAYLRTSLSLHD